MKRCCHCFFENEDMSTTCTSCGKNTEILVTNSADPRFLLVGSLLQNRYQIGDVVGTGGFGITYAAWDKLLNQKVAIKEYLPGEFSTRTFGESQVTIYGGEKEEQFEAGKVKFYEEAVKLSSFQGTDGIVSIYNSFNENKTAYIVMEFLDGETLAQKLEREKTIPEKEAIAIMTPVLHALEIVHEKGILHRDIAPNNIFITNEGKVKLLDFGSARSATGTYSKSLTVLYKEGYTPDEQYRSNGQQGSYTDVYACAATLYRMITGVLPVNALERWRKDTIKKPSHYVKEVSPHVDRAIMNALNVRAEERTQTAGQFYQELSGSTKVKDRFVRTMEKKIGRIPVGFKILFATSAAVLVVLAGLLAGGVISFDILGGSDYLVPDGKSRVPNLVNKEQDEAQELLESKNLTYVVDSVVYSSSVPQNKVLSQSLRAGKIIDQGEQVVVTVSGGNKTKANGYELQDGEVFVPNLMNMTMEEALAILADNDLVGDIIYQEDDQYEENEVYKQGIEEGLVVEKGSKVSIYVNGTDDTGMAGGENNNNNNQANANNNQDNIANTANTANVVNNNTVNNPVNNTPETTTAETPSNTQTQQTNTQTQQTNTQTQQTTTQTTTQTPTETTTQTPTETPTQPTNTADDGVDFTVPDDAGWDYY